MSRARLYSPLFVVCAVVAGCGAKDEVALSVFEKIDRLGKYQTVYCTDSTDSQRALMPAEVLQLCSVLERLKVSPGTKGLFYPNVRWQFDAEGPSPAEDIVILVCYAPNRVVVDDEVYVLSSRDYAQLCKTARAADDDPLLQDSAAERSGSPRVNDESSVKNAD